MIVIDGRVFAGRATGIQYVSRGLLDSARSQGLHAQVIAPGPVSDPRVDRQVPISHARLWEQVALPVLAGRRTVLSLANTAPLLARHSIVFIHDLAPARNPLWFAPRMAWYGRTVAAAARRADQVLTPSQAVRLEVIALGVPAGRVHVVRPAVDMQPATDEQVRAARNTLGLHRPYVVLMGWADPRKDLATAVGAHRAVRGQIPHDLVLIGSAHPNFAPVMAPADAIVLGHLDDLTLRAVLTGAQVLLHPSRYEGFGLPPLEAWACRTPVLIADVPAVREATWNLAPALPIADTAAWAQALRGALTARLPVPMVPEWTWQDAGRMLLGRLA